MTKITIVDQSSWKGFELPSGHKLVWGQALETTNDVIRGIDNARFLAPLINSKVVEVTLDPDPTDQLVEAVASITKETDDTPAENVQETPKDVLPLTNPAQTGSGVGGAIPAPSVKPSEIKGSTPTSDK